MVDVDSETSDGRIAAMLKDITNRNGGGNHYNHLTDTVVVADDNPELLAALEYMIRRQDVDVDVHTADDGLEALQICRHVLPRVIVLDMFMPHMSGIEVLDALREDPNLRYAYVIFVSGMADDVHELESVASKADRHFMKPMDTDLLVAAIEDGLAAGRTRGGLLGRLDRRR